MSVQDHHGAEWAIDAGPVNFSLRDGRACTIRRMIEEDAPELCRVIPQTMSESDFMGYMPGEFKMTVEEERAFLRDHNARPCSMSLCAEMDGGIIAYAGAAAQERKRFAHHAEFGLCVAKAYWRQGLGRKLTQLAIDWGRCRDLHKLYLKVYAYNPRAIALYQQLGFIEEARLKDDVRRADGTLADTIIMAIYYTAR